jgi:hypothetical protein
LPATIGRRKGTELEEVIFNVYHNIRHFGGTVAARFFCVPRCRRFDSHSVDNRGDLFGVALCQGPLGLRTAQRPALSEVWAGCPVVTILGGAEEARRRQQGSAPAGLWLGL